MPNRKPQVMKYPGVMRYGRIEKYPKSPTFYMAKNTITGKFLAPSCSYTVATCRSNACCALQLPTFTTTDIPTWRMLFKRGWRIVKVEVRETKGEKTK